MSAARLRAVLPGFVISVDDCCVSWTVESRKMADGRLQSLESEDVKQPIDKLYVDAHDAEHIYAYLTTE